MSRATIDNEGIFGLERIVPWHADDQPYNERFTVARFSGVVLMFFIWWVGYRSMRSDRWCWWRVVAVYGWGTLMFAIEQYFSDGVTKITSFAIVAHNLGEWYLFFNIWMGKLAAQHMLIWIPFYLFFTVVATAFLDLKILFVVMSIQGATMDGAVFLSFQVMNHHRNEIGLRVLDNIKERRVCCCHCNPLFWGLVGSLLHGLSVIATFWGVNSGDSIWLVVGTIFQFPAFMCFVGLAAALEGYMRFIGPPTDRNSFNTFQAEQIERLLPYYANGKYREGSEYTHIGLCELADWNFSSNVCCVNKEIYSRERVRVMLKKTDGSSSDDESKLSLAASDALPPTSATVSEQHHRPNPNNNIGAHSSSSSSLNSPLGGAPDVELAELKVHKTVSYTKDKREAEEAGVSRAVNNEAYLGPLRHYHMYVILFIAFLFSCLVNLGYYFLN